MDAQRFLDSREREEPEGLASPPRGDEEARSPVEAFFDDEAPAPDYDGTLACVGAPAPAPAEDPSLLRCAWRELGSTRGLHFWPRDASPKAVALLLAELGRRPRARRRALSASAGEMPHSKRQRGPLFTTGARIGHGPLSYVVVRGHRFSIKWQTNHHGKFVEEFVNGDVSSLILDWSAVRKKKMKLARQGSLETAVDDAFIACARLMEQYPRAYVLNSGPRLWRCCRAGRAWIGYNARGLDIESAAWRPLRATPSGATRTICGTCRRRRVLIDQVARACFCMESRDGQRRARRSRSSSTRSPLARKKAEAAH